MKSSLSVYQKVRVGGRIVYVKPEALGPLSETEAIIFDCDGVLIDVRGSYNEAIGQTACFILSQLAGFAFPRRIITQSIIHTLRRSGGFNNDWNSTYVILLYLFSCLPKSFLVRFHQAHRELSESLEAVPSWAAPLGSLVHRLSGKLTKDQVRTSTERLRHGLLRFAGQADSSGIASLESLLLADREPVWKRDALRSLKSLLGYPEQAAQSLLANLFDEIFYGPALFEKVRGSRPRFYIGGGAIESETPIMTPPTMKRLAASVGRSNLGIASGRGTIAARHTLGPLLDSFNPNACVFLEDDELNPRDDQIARAERAKPAPYSLLKAGGVMNRFRRALYVGDSAEDLIMTRRANERDARYLFAAVTELGYDPRGKQAMFAELGADLILPSVNQLPGLLLPGRNARVSAADDRNP